MQQRTRKLEQEMEEVRARETENRMDYQREKGEVAVDLDRIEMNHLQDVRRVKDTTIEQQVESRKVRAEQDKQTASLEQEGQAHKANMGDL